MIAVDTNILLYAYNTEAPEHERASDALTGLVQGPWALPASVPFEFFAAATSRAVGGDLEVVTAAIDQWLATPGCTVLVDPPDIWDRVRPLVAAAGISGAQVHDARIAATCLAHGVAELWTNDGDFLAFPQLRVRNPLVV